MSTTHDIDPRDARIAELEDLLVERDVLIAEQSARIAQLEALVEKMARRLGMSSQNSSKPPSSDNPKARAERKRRSSKAARGGQPGHTGHKRALLPVEQVDHLLHHYPAQCACGSELTPSHVHGAPERWQQFELVPKLFSCTEYQLHACRCPSCGQTTRAPRSARRNAWDGDHA